MGKNFLVEVKRLRKREMEKLRQWGFRVME